MPVSGVELEKVMPSVPICGTFVGSNLVVMNGGVTPTGATLGVGTFTIYNTSSGVERSFNGLQTLNRVAWNAVTLGGLAWTICSNSGSSLQSIDPDTGSVTNISGQSFAGSGMEVAGGRVWINTTFTLYGYSPSANNWVSGTSGGTTAMGVIDGRLFTGSSRTLREHDPADASTIATYTTPVAVNFGGGRAAAIGDNLYFSTSTSGTVYRFNNTTSTISTLQLTPAGAPVMGDGWIAHQGLLIGFGPSSTSPGPLNIVDPATGRWESIANADLPTNKTRRYFVISDGSKVYLPSGIPIS